MMFYKLQLIIASSFAICAGATQTITAYPPPPTETSVSQCNTGSLYCCNYAGYANLVPGISTILGLLDIAIDPVNALIGLSCTPLFPFTPCDAYVLCCTNNDYNGLIVIGCNNVIY